MPLIGGTRLVSASRCCRRQIAGIAEPRQFHVLTYTDGHVLRMPLHFNSHFSKFSATLRYRLLTPAKCPRLRRDRLHFSRTMRLYLSFTGQQYIIAAHQLSALQPQRAG